MTYTHRLLQIILVLTAYLLLASVSEEVREVSAETPAATLIAHWQFDEGSGTAVADSSGNGHDGTVVGASWSDDVPLVTGADGQSLAFATDDYIDTAAFDVPNSFSISAWIKPSASDGRAIIAKHNSGGGNQLVFGLYRDSYHVNIRGSYFDGPAVFLDTWQHIVLTAAEDPQDVQTLTYIRLYLNGELIAGPETLTKQLGDTSEGRDWTIGQEWDGAARGDFFDGNIDDLRIYDGVLTPAEVRKLSATFSGTARIESDSKPTIKDAVASGAWRTVEIGSGTFTADNMASSQDISIIGSGKSSTFIEPTDTGQTDCDTRFLSYGGSGTALVKGLRLQLYCFDDNVGGGAIFNSSTSTVQVSDVTLSGAMSRTEDGGSILNFGTLLVENTIIQAGYAKNGGAIVNAVTGATTIIDSLLDSNQAQGVGGALFNSGTMTLIDSSVTNNTATASGGGILNYGIFNMRNGQVSENRSELYGGGIYNDDFRDNPGQASIVGTEFSANVAQYDGGGIGNWGALTLERGRMVGNGAGRGGGGIHNSQLAAMLDVLSSNFEENYAVEAGSALRNESDATIVNTTFWNNKKYPEARGTVPASVFVSGSETDFTMRHVTIYGTAQSGAGLMVYGGDLTVRNSLFATGDLAGCLLLGSDISLTHSGNLADNSCSDFATVDAIELTYDDDSGVAMISADSPARNAADPAFCEIYDQRGNRRLGPPCDVGSYEYGDVFNVFLPAVIR